MKKIFIVLSMTMALSQRGLAGNQPGSGISGNDQNPPASQADKSANDYDMWYE